MARFNHNFGKTDYLRQFPLKVPRASHGKAEVGAAAVWGGRGDQGKSTVSPPSVNLHEIF